MSSEESISCHQAAAARVAIAASRTSVLAKRHLGRRGAVSERRCEPGAQVSREVVSPPQHADGDAGVVESRELSADVGGQRMLLRALREARRLDVDDRAAPPRDRALQETVGKARRDARGHDAELERLRGGPAPSTSSAATGL